MKISRYYCRNFVFKIFNGYGNNDVTLQAGGGRFIGTPCIAYILQSLVKILFLCVFNS